MKGLRTMVMATVLVLGGLVATAVEAESTKPVRSSASKVSAGAPATSAEVKAEIGKVRAAVKGVQNEVKTTRKVTLVVMMGLACLMIFLYAKVGMVEKKLLKK